MVDDRPPSGCEPESDCAAGTLPYSKTAAAQSAVWMKIGQELRACYEVPQDLPPEMLALLMQLNDRREEVTSPRSVGVRARRGGHPVLARFHVFSCRAPLGLGSPTWLRPSSASPGSGQTDSKGMPDPLQLAPFAHGIRTSDDCAHSPEWSRDPSVDKTQVRSISSSWTIVPHRWAEWRSIYPAAPSNLGASIA